MLNNIIKIFLFLLLSSCTVGPDYQRPSIADDGVIAKELQLKSNNNLPTDWYNIFNDPQLSNLVRIALEYNTDINAAVARLKQARATLAINNVAFLPQINAQANYNYDKSSRNIALAANSDYYNIGFDASWELDIWGKGRRQTESDIASVKSMEYSLQDIKNSITAEIVANYISLLQNIEKLHLAKENEHLQQELFLMVQNKYKSGLSDELTYYQAKYLLENTKAQIPQYESNIVAYKNAISVLCGQFPSLLEKNKIISSVLREKIPDYSKQLNNLPAYVIRLRPDVAAAEQQLISANAQIGKAIAEIYPDVTISALWGYAAQKEAKLFNSRSQTYGYEPLISIPILDWKRLSNNVELQKYIKEEQLNNYKKAVLSAIQELKDAMTQYSNNLLSLQHSRESWLNADKAAELSRKKYESGLVDFSILLNAQQDMISAQQSYIDNLSNVYLSIIAYYKATGAPVSYN